MQNVTPFMTWRVNIFFPTKVIYLQFYNVSCVYNWHLCRLLPSLVVYSVSAAHGTKLVISSTAPDGFFYVKRLSSLAVMFYLSVFQHLAHHIMLNSRHSYSLLLCIPLFWEIVVLVFFLSLVESNCYMILNTRLFIFIRFVRWFSFLQKVTISD